jgi:signal peptidase I
MSVTPQVKRQEGGIAETVRVIVHALIIAVVIRSFLFQPFNIPSGSMENTLLVGDYLFVSKFSYGYSHYSLPFSLPLFSGRIWSANPQRGDVVVFRLPKDDSIDYIKRVIGLPGDRLQVRDGVVYINDMPVKREAIEPIDETDRFGRTEHVKRWQETLPNGVSYVTLERYPPNLENTPVFEVPQGHFFMMGDNRDNSSDSRDPSSGVGYVPLENLIGRAQLIFFSTQGEHAWAFWTWPWSLRWGRFFSLVR